MKRIIVWCLVLALQGFSASAQELSASVTSDPIWQQATAGGSFDLRVFGRCARDEERFRTLAERFEAADTTLVLTDLLILYYGSAYRDEYDGGYDRTVDRTTKENDPEQAYRICTEALKRHPASPGLIGEALTLAERIGRPREELNRLAWQRKMLLWSIYSLGNGTQESPYIVMRVADEYEMMFSLLGVDRVLKQSLARGSDGTTCDRLETSGGDRALYDGTELWFDVSYPLIMLTDPHHWSKRLAGEGKR